MTTDNLLSGLLGAVIATVLSVLYLYFAEAIRRRRDVYLAVVKYIDDIYIRLQAIFVFTHFKYTSERLPTYDVQGMTDSDVHKVHREVTELILSHGIRSQVAVVYGESPLLHKLAELFEHFLQVNKNLGMATKSAWIVKEQKEIYDLFEKTIDPIRRQLQERYRKETSLIGIIRSLLCLTCHPSSPQ